MRLPRKYPRMAAGWRIRLLKVGFPVGFRRKDNFEKEPYMLNLYSNVEYNVPGDTYFACEEPAYYIIYTEYDQGAGCYEMELLEEIGMYSGDRSPMGPKWYAGTYDEAIDVIQDVMANFPNV